MLEVLPVTVLMLALLASGPLAAQLPPQQSVPPPPARLGSDMRGDMQRIPVFHHELTGFASYSMEEHKVVFEWKRKLSEEVSRKSYQVESVTFWPTAVAAGAEGVIYVGGKTLKGKTIIQRWQIDTDPELQPALETAGGTVYPDTEIGVLRFPMYRDDLAGQRLVSVLFANRGALGAIAQFDDSRDLHYVDHEGAATIVMSATPDPTAEFQPALAGEFDRYRQLHHARWGYVYCLHPGSSRTFVLFDSDRDGRLDPQAARWVTPEQWYDEGFQQESNYLN